LDLANVLAHENTVLLQTTMGAVAVTEQAIIIEAHERGVVVPNRKARLTDEIHKQQVPMLLTPKKECGNTLVVSTSTACIHRLFVRSTWDQKPLWVNCVPRQLID
jgi:hypothetical protein